jgi:hypothetical protein
MKGPLLIFSFVEPPIVISEFSFQPLLKSIAKFLEMNPDT